MYLGSIDELADDICNKIEGDFDVEDYAKIIKAIVGKLKSRALTRMREIEKKNAEGKENIESLKVFFNTNLYKPE